MPPICPTSEQLSEFFTEQVVNGELELEEHVEDCPDCQARVSVLVGSDDLGLRAALSGAEADVLESNCRLAMEHIAQLTPHIVKDEHTASAKPRADLKFPTLGVYKLLAVLGKGGMGTVYKAEHVRLERIVALKVLPADRVQSSDALARFLREMKAVGALNHENIVHASDANESEGRYYIAMEYVRGCDVSQIVRAVGQLTVADACEIVRQAAIGLQHVHQAGLVHRDVKPANLMVTETGVVKILDLGLALLGSIVPASDGPTSTGQVIGTLDYISPEQAQNSHRVDRRADIFSLGATFYKLLTGRAPFDQASKLMDRLLALANSAPAPLTQFREDIPEALLAILGRMLSKSPSDRPTTCSEIAILLAQFAEGHNLPKLLSDILPLVAEREQPVVLESVPVVGNPTPSQLALTASISPPRIQRRQWIWQASTITLGVATLALAAWSLGSNMATNRANSPAPSAAPVLMVFVCQVDSQGQIVTRQPLGADESLRTADRVQIEVHPRQAGPVTLLFIDSHGKVNVLTSGPVPDLKTIVYPNNDTIQLDEATGLETFLLVEGADSESLRKNAQQEIDHAIQGAAVRSSDFKINRGQLDAFLHKWQSHSRSEFRVINHLPQ